ncbi:MAG: hypothetical protein LBG04_01335 [Holosporaceae bacterium]|jgi:hypothetical protein|nr:hypothetical protein [Holosporaceae bacterium]
MQIQCCGNNVRNNGIVGRAQEEAQLARALIHNKIFPTWVFHGISGVGKTRVAIKFAKHLLADVIPMEESLGGGLDDAAHKLVDSRIHPDFFMQEQTSEPSTIEEARALFLRVRKTPALSKRRVVIWENASDLNKNICNSLLKILEEPPAHTVIILICNGIGAIPQTLLSRAAKIYFPPLEESAIKLILDAMNIKNSDRLAQLAEGSAGYAWQLHENNGIEIYNNILSAFSSGGDIYPKTLKWIIDNNLCDNFQIIKTSILRILKIYTNLLGKICDDKYFEEIKILSPTVAKKIYPEREIGKIQEIILMLNLSETLSLDKNAAIVNVFEQFFKGGNESRY